MANITSLAELQAINDALDGDYVLTDNIDATATSGWNANAGFVPLGNSSTKFTGTFDGGDYTISNLFIDRDTTDYIGLFGYTDGATIQDLVLTGLDITGDDSVGGLVGRCLDSVVSGCTTAGAVVGDDDVGGGIGYLTGEASAVSDCSSSATATSADKTAGGFVGGHYGGTITDCSATGAVAGENYAGGFVGYQYAGGGVAGCDGSITQSYATGAVTSNGGLHWVGGFAGFVSGQVSECYSTGAPSYVAPATYAFAGGFAGGVGATATVADCYATGNADGGADAGYEAGFAGLTYSGGTVTDSFSTGSIGGSSNATHQSGFAVGAATATNCFWDTTTSSESESDLGTGLATAGMKAYATYDNAGWDLADVWYMSNDGTMYPSVRAFTAHAPWVVTEVPSWTETTATLKMRWFDPEGTGTEVRFQHGTTDAYGTDTTYVIPGPGEGTYYLNITGLTNGDTYNFRGQAKNTTGTGSGQDMAFTLSSSDTAISDAGWVWIEGADFHWIDANGVERISLAQSDVDDTPVDGATTAPVSSNWAYDHDNDDDVHDATAVNVSELGTATYDDVQDFVNQFGQRTQITGMVISDNYDGTAAISAGTGWCKVSDDINAEGKFFDFAGANTSALTDLSINYIYLDYNGGTPALAVDTAGGLFFEYDHIILGCAFRHGTHVHIINSSYAGLDSAHRTKLRLYEDNGAHRTSGCVASSTGTRNLAITAGVIYVGLTRQVTLSFDTSAVTQGTATATTAYRLIDSGATFTTNDVEKRLKNTTSGTEYTDVVAFVSSTELRIKDDIFLDTETYDLYDSWDGWYSSDGGTTWVQVEGTTQVDNTYYNKTTSPYNLVELTANRYAIHWLYIDEEGKHLHMVYGQGDYTAPQVEGAAIPSSLPPIASGFGILLAKIVVAKASDTLIIAYPWTTSIPTSLAQDHGNLAGLGDDDHTQYVKDTEFTADSEILVGTGTGTFQKESGATLRTSIGTYSTAETDSAIDTDVATHAAIKSANAVLGHVIVETASLIDVDGDGKLTLGAHASTHENAGGDEVSVAGLSGLLADDQHVLDTEVLALVITLGG